MPTGYTAELMEKGMPFRKFALQCARAFGACISQRDEAIEALPRKLEPSDYHDESIKEAAADLKRLEGMTNKQRIAYGKKMRSESIADAKDAISRDRKENARLDAMAARVSAWEPPSGEHKGLKDFMLEQIKISRHDEAFAMKWLRDAEAKSPVGYYAQAVSEAKRDVQYHTKERQEESKRTSGRNDWIEQLYKSLPKR